MSTYRNWRLIDMEENRSSSISKADSEEKIGEFWDTHDFTEFDANTPDAEFEIMTPVEDSEHVITDPYARRDPLYVRLKTKALSNQLAIAVGSSLSDDKYSIPSIGQQIIKEFNVDVTIQERYLFFHKWNDIVLEAEKKTSRSDLIKFVHDIVTDAEPGTIHKKLALIPISNFIDATFDRSLYKALLAAGRKPITHDWGTSQAMGIWKQSKPEEPTVFFMLPPTENEKSSWGSMNLPVEAKVTI
jgi:hypothetical protein